LWKSLPGQRDKKRELAELEAQIAEHKARRSRIENDTI